MVAQGVRYLLDLGHRHFAMLAGVTRGNDRAAERVQGVREALRGVGLGLPATALQEAPTTCSRRAGPRAGC